jgi:hypothetical protein
MEEKLHIGNLEEHRKIWGDHVNRKVVLVGSGPGVSAVASAIATAHGICANRVEHIHSIDEIQHSNEELIEVGILPEPTILPYTARPELPEIEMFDMKYSHLTKKKREAIIIPVRTEPKIFRNRPCPCGSGKKYKYCCAK